MKSATGTWTWSSLVVAAVTACFLVANGVHAGTNPCVSAPCLNGATCTNITATTFNCTCVPGWSGTTCQTNINECASSPCANSATCIDGVNSYSCTCVAGWSGTTCQTQIDECASFPCLNSATCVDGVNSFSCSCVPGWTGSTCQTQIDECASAPCVNSATCVDGLNSWTCVCVPGWSGVFCQTDIPECASNPCQNSGICVDLVNGFDCDCVNGWNGTVCNENDLGYVCANYNESIGQPCFTCGCPVGFVGDRCHEHLCQLQPCVVNNTQSCVGTSSGSGFQCNCVPGFLGIYCQTDLDECASSPCNTSISNCTDLINGYRCDYCSSFQPCMNGGTCVSNTTAPGSFTCTCPTGAIGSSCSQCDTGSGYHFCAGQNCVNWQTDINNCGGCGIRCDPASQVCSSSSCVSNVPTTDVRYSTRGPMRCCTALLPLFGAGALGAILVIYLWPIMLHGSANPTSIEISTPSFIVNYSIYPTSCGTKGSITTCWEAYVDVSPVNSTVVCSLEKSVYNSIADALYELRRDNPISNTTVVTVYFDSSKRMCSWSSVPIPEDWTLLAPFIIVFMIGLIAGGLGGMGIGFVLDLLFDFCCPCCCRNC